MTIGKGVDTQPGADLKSREEEISEFRASLGLLTTKAKEIKDESVEVANLKQRIGKLDQDVDKLILVKKNKDKFTKKLADLTKQRSALAIEVEEVKHGVANWQVQKLELEDQRQKFKTDTELAEFNKFNTRYLDAKEGLEALVNFLKKYNLEKGKEDLVEQFEKKLGEIKILLDEKKYTDIINQSDKFIYQVRNALMTANDEKMAQDELAGTTERANDTEPPAAESAAATPAEPALDTTPAEPAKLADSTPALSQRQRKEKGIVKKQLVPSLGLGKEEPRVPADTEKERKEQDKEDEDYKNAKSSIDLLKSIITSGGKNNYALKRFAAEFKQADSSLRVARFTELPEIFARNLRNIEEEIEKILSKAGPGLKKAYEESQKTGVAQPIESVQREPADTEKERKEQDKEDQDYAKAKSNLNLLESIITDGGKNNRALQRFAGEFKKADSSLRVARFTKLPEIFAKNLQNIEEEIEKILSKAGPGLKKAYEESQKTGVAQPIEPPPEPEINKPPAATAEASEGKSAVNKKEHDQRKRLCDDRWAEVMRLEKVIRDIDSKEKKHNKLVKQYQSSLSAVKELLKKSFASLDNTEEFDESIAKFTDAYRDIVAGLPPEIETALKRGGAKKAEPQILNIEKGSEVQEKRALLHAELSEYLSILEDNINKKVKNKPADYFAKRIAKLHDYLENAQKKDFDENIRNFNDLIHKVSEEAENAMIESKKLAKEAEVAPLSTEPVVPFEVIPKKVRVRKARAAKEAAPVLVTVTAEVLESSEKKRRILDIPERDLLEIVGEKKLHEVVNEIILGNADVAMVLMKDIFSRKDIDLKHLNSVLEKFGYTPVQFMKEWAETLHVRAFEATKQWVEQMSRNWLNKNIKLWDKLKENPMAHAKLMAVNILPFAALGGSIGVLVATGGGTHIARGAIVGGATGLLRGLKAKVGSVRGWFEKRKEKAREQIATGVAKIEEEKALPLRDSLLAQFAGENRPEMMEQLSAMLSQSLRDASAAGVQKEAVEKLKSGAAIAVEEISAKIDIEFEAMKKSAGEETASEVQRSQTERAETLIKKLYEDKDLEALIQKLIERDPKIVSKLKGLKINGIEFGKFIKEGDKDPAKNESDARKVVSVLAAGVAGASIGGAFAAAPELRAVLGAVAGGYLGVKYGHLKDRHAREAQFEKEFKDNIANAEKIIEEWEKRKSKEPYLEPTPENIKELSERAKDLRAPLNLGMLESDINLKLRAQNALRRLESLQINLYINQNPGVEERAIPEGQRNTGVERLLTGLNSELEELTKHQQNIEQRILRKPGWWRAVGYGVVGAVAGAGLGYGTAKAQEYWRAGHKQVLHPTAEEGTQHPQIAQGEGKTPVVDSSALEHPPAIEPHEVPVLTEPVVRADHTVAVEVLNNKEGILSGVNKIIRSHPDAFTHPDGKAWTANEIHLWKVHELKEMGFKYEGGKWGYPMTVHGGAQVEVYTDEQGQPHFKLVSDEHVTFNKNYKWADTEPTKITTPEELRVITEKENFKIVDTGAVAGRKGDYVINPFPEDSGVAHAPVKVDANIRDMAVVHHAPKVSEAIGKDQPATQQGVVEKTSPAKSSVVTPEKIVVAPDQYADAPISKFLVERGTNSGEFIGSIQNMRGAMEIRLDNSLAYTGGGGKFLQEKMHHLYDLQQKYVDELASGKKLSAADLKEIDTLIRIEKMYKSGNSAWVESLGKAVFDKDDSKVMSLAFAPHTNVVDHPILTEGHAARIWSSTKKKDVFWYEEGSTFSLDKNGNLIEKNASGIHVTPKEEVLKMVNE